ncbi:hypothetical protein J437_LFUL004912 [Ladona fulva]|uniref:Uncharacterized protein n=1 Tax=Ladona fulva TaxID=123851 RepID=A0A8K0P114_LADFU|nr:hypothetical protein J437_LFUL004912 [Ladona fulva]
MIKVAKEIASKKGILSTPNQKIGRVSDEEIVFRLVPGKKDFISIAGDDERLQNQKRLVLSNIK